MAQGKERKTMRRVALVAVAAMATITTACATIGRAAFVQPVVSLRDVRIVGLGVTGGNLDVVLSVYNPNGYRLDATKLRYRVQVDSTQLGIGEIDSRFTVNDKDSTTVRIPVQFSYAGLGAAGRSIMNTGALNYRVTGEVTVATGFGDHTVPFSQTGRYSTLSR
jgi:LEA14-like dessication related protein